jgi:hypothetical protein
MKKTGKKKTSRKKPATRKKTTKKKSPKKAAPTRKKAKPKTKSKATAKKRASSKKATAHRQRARIREKRSELDVLGLAPKRQGPPPGLQSGDLQGLSNLERADSESVDELLEEGNAFEAGVITGVEDADDSDEREVHTREVPVDDVPGEYFDDE